MITSLKLLHQQSDGISPYLRCPFCECADVESEFMSGPLPGYTQCGQCAAIAETAWFVLMHDKDADLYDEEDKRFYHYCSLRAYGYAPDADSQFPDFDQEEKYRMKNPLKEPQEISRRHVIYSDQHGVYLGDGLWSNSDLFLKIASHAPPAEKPIVAPTYANALEATQEVSNYADSFPTYRLVEVHCSNGETATVNDCANANLPRWGE